MHILSTILSSDSIWGYSIAIFLKISRYSPSVYFIIFALWTPVTFFLLFFIAYSKAYLIILSELVTDIGFIVIPLSSLITISFFFLRESMTFSGRTVPSFS